MIKNERQYRITKARVEDFERALAALSPKTATAPEDILWLKVQTDAISSQLEELRSGVKEYETLRAEGPNVLELDSLDRLPQTLIKARIAAGLTQKDLADRLHLKEQQIQRYEATDYAGASLERVGEIMRALGITLAKGLLSPRNETTLGQLLKRMRSVGLAKEFVQDRLLPKILASHLRAGVAPDERRTQMWALQTAARVSRIFSWPTEEIFGDVPLSFHRDLLAQARFKVPARADEQFFVAYSVYAHYLGLVLLQCTSHIKTRAIPMTADEFRSALQGLANRITLEGVLTYAWDHLGIPILPLNDPGAFHGACWRINGRNLVVLKQRTASYARWIIDLLHELRHLAKRQSEKHVSIVEPQRLTNDAPSDLVDEELEATHFAGEVALGGRAEDLAQKCVNRARGKLEWLKAAVPQVAKDEGVPVDLLANYLAYRLSLQGENWWGAAQNLQHESGDPWRIARDFLLARATFENVNPIDKELLLQALSDPG
jgi:ribosome-binding protein aMBF1 (putative translation factor)